MTNIIICSPGLRMSDEDMWRSVWVALKGVLQAPPRVTQRVVEEGDLASATFVIVELGVDDRAADESLLVIRLQKLLCPTKIGVDDADVSVAVV